MERIHGPALKSPEGDLYADPIPASHWSIAQLVKNLVPDSVNVLRDWEQGFLTTDERFVDRKEAYRIAALAGQIVSHVPDPESGRKLFSEDLWCTGLYK
jgi:hypothetical protein